MKKKTMSMAAAFVMALVLLFGAVGPGTEIFASSKEVRQLKKLQSKLKKKKKFSKSYKTELGGTAQVTWTYYKHNAKVTRKGKYIVFTDNVGLHYSGSANTTYEIKMKMKVGNNKKVKISLHEKYKGKTEEKCSTTLKPSKYKYGMKLSYMNSKHKKLNYMRYDNITYLALRSWDNLISKKAGVSMKSIGFKKFKNKEI